MVYVLQYSHIAFLLAKVASPPRCIACRGEERRLLVIVYGPHNVEGCLILNNTFCLLAFLSGPCGSAGRNRRFTRVGSTGQHHTEKGFWRQEPIERVGLFEWDASGEAGLVPTRHNKARSTIHTGDAVLVTQGHPGDTPARAAK